MAISSALLAEASPLTRVEASGIEPIFTSKGSIPVHTGRRQSVRTAFREKMKHPRSHEEKASESRLRRMMNEPLRDRKPSSSE